MYGITLKLHLTFGTIGNTAANENALKSCRQKLEFCFSVKNYPEHADM